MLNNYGYEDEEWRGVVGFPNYAISNFGRVWNIKHERFLTPSFEPNGYAHVHLYYNGKPTIIDIHRLVALSFLSRSQDEIEVNHDDGDKYYNHVDNLEWTTKSVNRKHAYTTGLQLPSNRQAVRIVETGETFESLSDCAVSIAGQHSAIGACLSGKRKRHHGFTFEYIDKEAF